jgi:hypothetical protein
MRPTRMLYRPGAWDVSTRFFRSGEMLLLHPCSPGSGIRPPAMIALRGCVWLSGVQRSSVMSSQILSFS